MGKESEEEGLFTPVIFVVQKGEKEEGRGEEELEKSLFFPGRENGMQGRDLQAQKRNEKSPE